ncbi:hypothetical protein SS50377_27480 [Spironucleus salmonicida]|uniref:Uncharacterized protein n=1 Tax=Spironucleus salmonicida TaxID=348837 RepID=V6LTA6_9EUKA|nr:hypothetical protein SS50377_27480 [Spironucleus salmonicida]|eukprot:EST46926.1 Hypothetical protein SS50377_13083 [Spironucleus salmonicida]
MLLQVYDDENADFIQNFLSFLSYHDIQAELYDSLDPKPLVITLSFKGFKSLKNKLKASVKQNSSSTKIQFITILNIFEVGSLDILTVDQEQQEIMFMEAIPMLQNIASQDEWNLSLTAAITSKLVSEEILYKIKVDYENDDE